MAFLTARIYSYVGSGPSSSAAGIYSSPVDSELTIALSEDLGFSSIFLDGLFF
jgi:hypothetical protein